MVSDIHSGGLSKIGQAHTAGSKAIKPASEPSSGAAPSVKTEVVTLTDLSARLRELTEAIAKAPEVDQAKVQALRAQIEAGTYAIDERQIAEKFSAFEALMSATSRD